MTINQRAARGYNFFVIAVLGIVAGSLVGEIPAEGVWIFKLDDLLVVAVGVVAVAWYLVGQHRYQRSLVPLALAMAAFTAKVLGVILEFRDTLEVSDDFNMVQVLFFLLIVAAVVYYRTRPAELEGASKPMSGAASQMPSRIGR